MRSFTLLLLSALLFAPATARADDTPADAPTPPPPPRRDPFVLSAGAGVTGAQLGAHPSALVAVSLLARPRVAVDAWGVVPIAPKTIDAAQARSEVRAWMTGLGVSWVLSDPRGFVVGRLGAGWGAMLLHVRADSADATSRLVPRPGSDDLATILGYASADLGVRITDWLRVGAYGTAGTTLHQLVVKQGSGDKTFGVPFGFSGLRAEVVL